VCTKDQASEFALKYNVRGVTWENRSTTFSTVYNEIAQIPDYRGINLNDIPWDNVKELLEKRNIYSVSAIDDAIKQLKDDDVNDLKIPIEILRQIGNFSYFDIYEFDDINWTKTPITRCKYSNKALYQLENKDGKKVYAYGSILTSIKFYMLALHKLDPFESCLQPYFVKWGFEFEFISLAPFFELCHCLQTFSSLIRNTIHEKTTNDETDDVRIERVINYIDNSLISVASQGGFDSFMNTFKHIQADDHQSLIAEFAKINGQAFAFISISDDDDDNYELITKPTISGYGILHTFRKNNPAKREFYLIKCNTITNAPISLISLKLNDNV